MTPDPDLGLLFTKCWQDWYTFPDHHQRQIHPWDFSPFYELNLQHDFESFICALSYFKINLKSNNPKVT